MNKKIIFIDWNKTLSYSLFWEHLKDGTHKYNKYHKVFENWLFVKNSELINSWMRGAISEDEILAKMSADTGVSKQLIQSELAQSCAQMALCSAEIKGLVRKIQDNGSLVVIATDNMDIFRKYTVPALKLDSFFDDILISSEIGALKDDKDPIGKIAFFDPYLKQKGVHYDDVALLDDSPDSSGKYQQMGFRRILINSPNSLIKTLKELAVDA